MQVLVLNVKYYSDTAPSKSKEICSALLISFNFCQIIVNCWPLIKDPSVLHAIENLVFVGGPVFELSVIFT